MIISKFRIDVHLLVLYRCLFISIVSMFNYGTDVNISMLYGCLFISIVSMFINRPRIDEYL